MEPLNEDSIDKPGQTPMILRAAPYALMLIIAGWLLMGVFKVTQPDGMSRFDLDAFGRVPVSQDGRIKPLDTVARNALLQVSGKQSLKDDMLLPDEGGVEKPAILWLAEFRRAAGVVEMHVRHDHVTHLLR